MNLNELIEPNLNNYYKGSFTIHQNKIDYILIVPFTYPYKYFYLDLDNLQSGLQVGKARKKMRGNLLMF